MLHEAIPLALRGIEVAAPSNVKATLPDAEPSLCPASNFAPTGCAVRYAG